MGGNCELTAPGADVVKHDVTIHGPIRLAATIPIHASQMYSRNITTFALLLIQKGNLVLNFEDDIVRDTCVTHEGQVRHAPTRERIEGAGGGTPSGAPRSAA
jgi:NAD(P) transhydrogenase subunit alpha